tara:strand:+ start:397 stop:1611 length:1215 start_codon:yes stop_codon:yes gene_type:complete
MGASTDHALGRNLRFFCKKETDSGTDYPGGRYGTANQIALSGSNAAKVLSSSMEFTVARNDRMDSRTSRSVLERITGKQEISWSCESYLLPKGSTTAPDIDPFIEAAMGGSFGGSTAKTYEFSDSNALPTCRVARTANGVLREDLFGAYVEEMSISASGGEEPKISFSGGAFNYALTGTGTTHASSAPSATSVPLVSGDGVNFMVGSCIDINGGSAIVTAKSAADTLTVTSGSYATGEAVTPETYTETGAGGSPINGISGSLTLNSVSLPVTSFDVTVTNGIKALSDEAFEKGTSDFVAGFRSVKGNISVRARKDFIKSLAQRYVQLNGTDPTATNYDPTFSSVALVVTMGSTTGYKVVATMSKVEIDFAGIEIPESEEAVLSLPFTALGTSGSDELTLAWNQD